MNHHALALVVIFTGGGIGSAARHLVNQIAPQPLARIRVGARSS